MDVFGPKRTANPVTNNVLATHSLPVKEIYGGCRKVGEDLSNSSTRSQIKKCPFMNVVRIEVINDRVISNFIIASTFSIISACI